LRVVPRAGASSSCAAAPLLRLSGTVASIGPAPVPGLRGPAVLRGGLEANKHRIRLDMATAAQATTESIDEEGTLHVKIDNESDPECTVLTVEGKDQPHLLMTLSGALTTAGYLVVTADISNHDGRVFDVFHIQMEDGNQKIPESKFKELKQLILSMTSTTSNRSGMPAIYGVVAAAEVERLKPLSELSGVAAKGEVSSLELTAAEMAQAAANLVAQEREILDLQSKGADQRVLTVKEAGRREAAAVLERKMSAMEALLTTRRTISTEPARDKKQDSGADFMAKMKPEVSVSPACGTGKELLLQAFNWESCKQPWYKVLAGEVQDIKNCGFTAVWLPPPSDAVSDQGYLPRDLYNLNSKYGNEAELRNLISQFHEHQIKVIGDIVINHRCASFQGEDGKWNKYGGRLAWDASAICNNNPAFGGRGNPKQGDDYAAAPNIDHSQEWVRRDIIEWLRYLRNIGFDGWRFDFVRGWPGHFAKQYINETTPEMAFGEYWDSCDYTDGVLNYNQDGHRQQTVNWCDQTGGTASAFDFTTKGILQEAVSRREYWRLSDSQGRPPGVIGLWPSRAVTFLDNHDTGSTLNHWPYPWKNLPEGYAYLLTHPGTPCIFYDHLKTEGNGLRKAILDLINVRKAHGIHVRSKVTIRKASADVYAATIDDKLAMKIGPGDWSPNMVGIKINNKELKLNCSGHQFAVWEAQP